MVQGLALRFYRGHPKWDCRDPTSYRLEPIYSVR
jgi:hypothetical protein